MNGTRGPTNLPPRHPNYRSHEDREPLPIVLPPPTPAFNLKQKQEQKKKEDTESEQKKSPLFSPPPTQKAIKETFNPQDIVSYKKDGTIPLPIPEKIIPQKKADDNIALPKPEDIVSQKKQTTPLPMPQDKNASLSKPENVIPQGKQTPMEKNPTMKPSELQGAPLNKPLVNDLKEPKKTENLIVPLAKEGKDTSIPKSNLLQNDLKEPKKTENLIVPSAKEGKDTSIPKKIENVIVPSSERGEDVETYIAATPKPHHLLQKEKKEKPSEVPLTSPYQPQPLSENVQPITPTQTIQPPPTLNNYHQFVHLIQSVYVSAVQLHGHETTVVLKDGTSIHVQNNQGALSISVSTPHYHIQQLISKNRENIKKSLKEKKIEMRELNIGTAESSSITQTKQGEAQQQTGGQQQPPMTFYTAQAVQQQQERFYQEKKQKGKISEKEKIAGGEEVNEEQIKGIDETDTDSNL